MFGVRGEVKLHLHNHDSELLDGQRVVTLVGPKGERRDVRIRSRPGAGKRIIGQIDGLADRDQAMLLKDWRIVLPERDLPTPDDDEFYVYQVVGARVTMGGADVGRVREVHTDGPIDLFEIEAGEDTHFVPALEEFILRIDGESGVVELHEGAL